MAEIKDASRIAEKWARVTPGRAGDYTEGINNPRRDWAASTIAAEDSYKAGVTAAANAGRFGRGVRAAGTEKWRERAIAKGPQRFAEGVQLGQADYLAGFEPFAAVIRATNLPPRFPKGDPRNIDRVRVLAAALNKKRIGGT